MVGIVERNLPVGDMSVFEKRNTKMAQDERNRKMVRSLLIAVEHNNVDSVGEILRNNPGIERVAGDRALIDRNPLALALHHEYAAVAKLILENAPKELWFYPVRAWEQPQDRQEGVIELTVGHLAARFGDVEVMEKLLQKAPGVACQRNHARRYVHCDRDGKRMDEAYFEDVDDASPLVYAMQEYSMRRIGTEMMAKIVEMAPGSVLVEDADGLAALPWIINRLFAHNRSEETMEFLLEKAPQSLDAIPGKWKSMHEFAKRYHRDPRFAKRISKAEAAWGNVRKELEKVREDYDGMMKKIQEEAAVKLAATKQTMWKKAWKPAPDAKSKLKTPAPAPKGPGAS